MFIQIITQTPVWVWVILALLLWVGFKQSVARSVSLRRITVLPVVMTGLSLAGTLTAFGFGISALLAWGAGAAIAAAVVMQRHLPQGTHYNAWTQHFQIPSSFTPLVLMMGIFITKYAAGVAVAIYPDLALNVLFSQSISALYGGFSGVFVARAAQLWRLASAKTSGVTIPQGA